MSGIIGSKLNHRGSGLVGSLGTDGQHLLSSGAGKTNVFETVTAGVTEADLVATRQDILTLGLKQAVQENSTKFNLPNSSICKFEADADFNLGGSTNTSRNSSEYIWATSVGTAAFGTDSDTEIYMDFNSATTTMQGNDAATYTSAAGGSGLALNSSNKKFGANGLYVPNGAYLVLTPTQSSDIFYPVESGDWTIEFWHLSTGGEGYAHMVGKAHHGNNNFDWRMYMNSSGTPNQLLYNDVWYTDTEENTTDTSGAADTTAWTHYALTRDDDTQRFYENGIQTATDAVSGNVKNDYATIRIGESYVGSGTAQSYGYFDEFRLSKVCRYPDGTTFTPNSVAVTNATGTALGTTNVPTSNITEVSGVLLNKDTSGATTFGTDVKAYFTADNSNWTEATSYADAGTFSDTTKMIKLGKTTVTEGNDVRWKIVWANQSEGSKVSNIYGIGLNY